MYIAGMKIGMRIGTKIEMSIEMMVGVSRLLMGAAILFAVLTTVLFFVFRIPKCIRMVSGGYSIYEKKRQRAKKEKQCSPYTEKLSDLEPFAGDEETCLLEDIQETLLLETKDLEMIQDIVYMQDTEK